MLPSPEATVGIGGAPCCHAGRRNHVLLTSLLFSAPYFMPEPLILEDGVPGVRTSMLEPGPVGSDAPIPAQGGGHAGQGQREEDLNSPGGGSSVYLV